MKEVALKTQGYPGFLSNFENGAKQLEAQLKNGVANKRSVYQWNLLQGMA